MVSIDKLHICVEGVCILNNGCYGNGKRTYYYSCPCDRGQVVIKFGTNYVMFQKLVHFLEKNDIYVDKLESVVFSI